MSDEEVVYRRSQAETFGCPHRYDQIYNKGADDTGDEAQRGRAFHACAWVYVERLTQAQVTSDAAIADDAFNGGIQVTGCPDHLMEEVHGLFYRFAERFELNLQAILVAERLIRGAGRQFTPDLVYVHPGELEILDWKTYYRTLTEAQARKELQLKWYLVEAKKVWPGFDRYRFTHEFVRLHTSTSLVFTADEVDAFEGQVQASIDAIEEAKRTGEYPAIPGSHCGLCRVVCPLVDDPKRLPVRFVSSDQAKAGAGEMLALRQRSNALRQSLDSYCQEHGPVVVEGQEFLHVSGVTSKWSAADVVEFLEGRAVSVERLRIGRGGLGEYGRQSAHPTVKKWLAQYVIEEATSKFVNRKRGEADEDGG